MIQSSASRVRCELDFERAKRQTGYVRAPLSRNTAGWGTVEIPVTVVNNGTGPTVLLMGGVRGDEYEALRHTVCARPIYPPDLDVAFHPKTVLYKTCAP